MKKIIIFLFLFLNSSSSLLAQYFDKPITLYCDSIINKEYHNYFITDKIFPNNKFINIVSYDSLNSILQNNKDLKLIIDTRSLNRFESNSFSLINQNIRLEYEKIELSQINHISLVEEAGIKRSLTLGVASFLGGLFAFSVLEGVDYLFGKDFESKQVLYLSGGFSLLGFIGGAVFDRPKIDISFQL